MGTFRLFEHQHGACDLARLHRAERLVDVLQLAAPADHAVEVEAALAVVVKITRHVDTETVGAHDGTLNLALGQETGTVELDLLSDRNHPNDRRCAAHLKAFKTLLGELFYPDRFKRIVDA